MRFVRRRDTAAVRATRLLLDRRGGCWRILHAFQNNMEILLHPHYSCHHCDLLVEIPTHGFSAARQHQLKYPRWRCGALENATLAVWCLGEYLFEDRRPS